MFRRIIISSAAVAALGLVVVAGARVSARDGVSTSPQLAADVHSIAQPKTCPVQCQAAHNKCRVVRKGSPSCDADRQACIEKCLTKKKQKP